MSNKNNSNSPQVVIKMMGGLGNQMMQYAFGKSLSKVYNCPVTFDVTFFREPAEAYPRTLNIKEFNLDQDFTYSYFLSRSSRYLRGRLARHVLQPLLPMFGVVDIVEETLEYNEKYLQIQQGKKLYYNGYWQSENYFIDLKQELIEDFTISAPSKNFLEQERLIAERGSNAVSIHIRRGDYVTNQEANATHGVMGPNYYEKAVKLIYDQVANPHFFIFSDDLDWCRENLNFGKSTFMEGNDNFEDIILLSRCHHHIIANSSFSWWGSWLGEKEGSKIYCPHRWYQQHHADPAPSRWIKIK